LASSIAGASVVVDEPASVVVDHPVLYITGELERRHDVTNIIARRISLPGGG